MLKALFTRIFFQQVHRNKIIKFIECSELRMYNVHLPGNLSVAGGLSATSAVKITLTDVNDNKPIFFPLEYRVSFSANVSDNKPVAIVRATDADSGRFSQITYKLSTGGDENLFRIDHNTGELFVVSTRSLLHNRQYVLNISAIDGGGVRSAEEARAFITVTNAFQFGRSQYVFTVAEDVPLNTPLGNVDARFNGTYIFSFSLLFFFANA